MNSDNLFTILLNSNINKLVKILVVSKYISSCHTKYLWKLIYFRDKRTKKFIKSYQGSYLVDKEMKSTCWNNYDHVQKNYNKLKYLSSEIISLMDFKKLNNYGSYYIPHDIGYLVNLTFLDIGCNGLHGLPNEIFRLINLKRFFIGYNRLNILSSNIGNLTKLEVLSVRNNNFCCLPSEVGKLVNLRDLKLYDNPFRILISEIVLLTSLKQLTINKDKINLLPKNMSKFFDEGIVVTSNM